MVYEKKRINCRKWNAQNLLDANRPTNPGEKTNILINKKKRTYQLVWFAVPANYRRKTKEKEKLCK